MAAIRLYVTHARKFPSSRFQFQIALLEPEEVTRPCVLTTPSPGHPGLKSILLCLVLDPVRGYLCHSYLVTLEKRKVYFV